VVSEDDICHIAHLAHYQFVLEYVDVVASVTKEVLPHSLEMVKCLRVIDLLLLYHV
jgi:hypothetical protein